MLFLMPLKLFVGQSLLLFSLVENGRSILFAFVFALLVLRSRVVNFEEYVEELTIGNRTRVKFYFNSLCVVCLAIMHLLVGRVLLKASSITRDDLVHALHSEEDGGRDPKVAASKDC